MLDANIYISALEFGGKARALMLLARSGQFRIIASPGIRAEVERILKSKFGWDDARIHTLELTIWDAVQIVTPDEILPVCRDPRDDHVLAASKAGQANVIVSGDDDLLVLKSYDGAVIASLRDFLDSLARSGGFGPN